MGVKSVGESGVLGPGADPGASSSWSRSAAAAEVADAGERLIAL